MLQSHSEVSQQIQFEHRFLLRGLVVQCKRHVLRKERRVAYVRGGDSCFARRHRFTDHTFFLFSLSSGSDSCPTNLVPLHQLVSGGMILQIPLAVANIVAIDGLSIGIGLGKKRDDCCTMMWWRDARCVSHLVFYFFCLLSFLLCSASIFFSASSFSAQVSLRCSVDTIHSTTLPAATGALPAAPHQSTTI